MARQVGDQDEDCDLCGTPNTGSNLQVFQTFTNARVILCTVCALRAWIPANYFIGGRVCPR